jgi:GNAT superfamily N-acetyltransferase
VHLRQATPADFATFVVLMAELGVDDPTPTETAFVRDLMPTMLIAEGEAPLGYAYYQVLTGVTYIRQLVVAPEARGRRVGQRLMEAVAEIGRASGAATWCLNVKPENRSAIALYTRMGLREAYPSTAMRIPWTQVCGTIPTLPVRAEDEERVELATGVAAGLLARWRGSDARFARYAEADGEVVAMAIFAPDYPGAFPFRVMRPGFGERFLGAFRPWARFEYVNFVAEDQPALVAEMLAIGATVRMEIRHYRGSLTHTG